MARPHVVNLGVAFEEKKKNNDLYNLDDLAAMPLVQRGGEHLGSPKHSFQEKKTIFTISLTLTRLVLMMQRGEDPMGSPITGFQEGNQRSLLPRFILR